MTADTTREEEILLRALVEEYKADFRGFMRLSQNLQLLFSEVPNVHSMRIRAKDPEHLYDKLLKKLRKCKEANIPFDISEVNLTQKITDLAGIRLLHLHTSQFPAINSAVTRLLNNEGYTLKEGPVARTWDDEYRRIFEGMGIATEPNPRMYTSVHYVVEETSRSKRTAEIQIRMLAEELWGEVDHSLNYPAPCEVSSCKEQIKVLARATSTCTRLVDSIFHTKREADLRKP